MLHAKFEDNRISGSGQEDFKGFHHILTWWPYRSCDHIKFGIHWRSGLREKDV